MTSNAEDEDQPRRRPSGSASRATGKVLHRKATGNHMLTKKSGSRRRRVEGMSEVTAERKKIKRLSGGMSQMARVKRSVHAKKKRREILEKAKGYTGSRNTRYRVAKEQVMHSGDLRVPRPPGSQGAVPPAVDRPHQRGGPAARAVLLAVHATG